MTSVFYEKLQILNQADSALENGSQTMGTATSTDWSSSKKVPRFLRNTSRENVEKFRSRVGSIGKVGDSLCSTNRQQCINSQAQNKDEKDDEYSAAEQYQKAPVNKNSTYYHNIQHKKKPSILKQKFNKAYLPNNNQISQEQQVQKVKYMAMADILHYKENPVLNLKLIQRRLLNKMKVNTTYY